MTPPTATHRSRREFLRRAVAMGAGAVLPWKARRAMGGAPSGPPGRPNVILALSDQHRWQSMSFTDTPAMQTPEMARMAREGFSANRFFSNYPLCSPARALLLTGRWPSQTGVTDNRTRSRFNLSPEAPTLGHVFTEAGYDTAYVGKWHLGGESKGLAPFGFQHSMLWMNTNDHMNSRFIDSEGNRHRSERYNASHMTDQLLQFISEPRERPFFATVAWNVPHANFLDAPPEFMSLYPDDASLPSRSNWQPTPGASPEEVASGRLMARGYHAHVSALDQELGRLRQHLEGKGLAENTLVLYTSDHGAMLNSHGLQGKRLPYAESVRVPLLACWPGHIPAGVTTDVPLSLVDVLPTLCSLAGIRPPPGASGRDVSSMLLGKQGTEPTSQLILNLAAKPPRTGPKAGAPAPIYRGVVTDRYTYAATAEGPWLLFDDRYDPYQLRNRIDDPELREVQATLHLELTRWMSKTDDRFELRSGS